MTESLSRRDLLGRIVIGVGIAATAVAPLAGAADAAGAGAALPHLDPKDATAAALGYVPDASQVNAKKYVTYKAGQNCSSCIQLQGKAGDDWRPCGLFPKKLVSVNGWCSGYVKKP